MGVAAIKQIYFYYSQRNDLDMAYQDFSLIGAVAGMFTFYVALGGVRHIILGGLGGLMYGLLYSSIGKYSIHRRKKKAESLGITL